MDFKKQKSPFGTATPNGLRMFFCLSEERIEMIERPCDKIKRSRVQGK